jgi:putative ABC transport system permease protein
MFELAIENLKANKGRFVATIVAILVGVMFLSAGLIFTDAIKSSLGGSLADRYPNVAASVTDSQDRQGPPTKLPAELLDKVAAVPGVKAAAGEVEATVGIFTPGRKKSESIAARRWVTEPSLNATEIESGRAPAAAGEIAIDRHTASSKKLKLGDSVDLATNAGRVSYRVVGITKFGEDDSQEIGRAHV